MSKKKNNCIINERNKNDFCSFIKNSSGRIVKMGRYDVEGVRIE